MNNSVACCGVSNIKKLPSFLGLMGESRTKELYSPVKQKDERRKSCGKPLGIIKLNVEPLLGVKL